MGVVGDQDEVILEAVVEDLGQSCGKSVGSRDLLGLRPGKTFAGPYARLGWQVHGGGATRSTAWRTTSGSRSLASTVYQAQADDSHQDVRRAVFPKPASASMSVNRLPFTSSMRPVRRGRAIQAGERFGGRTLAIRVVSMAALDLRYRPRIKALR